MPRDKLRQLSKEIQTLPESNPVIDGPQPEKGLKVLSKCIVEHARIFKHNSNVMTVLTILLAIIAVFQLMLLL